MKTFINYVKQVSKRPENKLSESFYTEHILVVKKYALLLGKFYHIDTGLLRVAALLHDVSAMLDYQSILIHNIKSAEIAGNLLKQNGYQEEEIEIVKKCIEKHVVPLKESEGDIYSVILSNADAMAQIVRPEYWIYYAEQVKNLDKEAALKWYHDKVNNNWNGLIPVAREMIASDYAKTLETLRNYELIA